jgi:Zn-dependent M28 family amino/carboxypeptidase
MVSEPIPFDGRSDYVGFINRGIPAGGVFAGAEAPKTAAQVADYGGVEGEQLDPCYHQACEAPMLCAPVSRPYPRFEAHPWNAPAGMKEAVASYAHARR